VISTPTVFVLGAGTGVPFGFPTGDGLRREIIKSILGSYNEYVGLMPTVKPLENFKESILDALGDTAANRVQIRNFAVDMLDSGLSSVDVFLEHRQEFRDVGRVAIASALVRRESPQVISLSEGDWIIYLWNIMRDSLTNGGFNNVGFVTFNYDRTLEYRLTMAVSATLHLDTVEAWKIVQQWPIVHVYGQLATFHPVGDNNHRAYFDDVSGDSLKLSAASLRFIDERDDEPLEQARHLISKAQHLVFLGFGFDKTNVERLKTRNNNYNRNEFRIMSSSMGMTFGEVRRATDRVINAFEVRGTAAMAGQFGYETPKIDNIKFCEDTCLSTLREFADIISDV
jgi:hypothetical protein